MKIDLLDPVVEVAPGETAVCRVRVVNDTVGPSAYRLRIVGLNDVDIEYPLGFEPLAAGAEAHFDVGLEVPREFAAGRHALAVEILSDRRGERPVLAGMTVEVSSIHKVAMRLNPSTINGRTKGRFNVELDNRETRPVEIDLTGIGQGLRVKFARRRLLLQPGDVVAVAGTVIGKRRWFRDPKDHVVTVIAESKSAPIYADAHFRQRAVMPKRFRSGMAILAFLGLWAGILGAGAYWFTHREKKSDVTATAALVDTNGDGIPDAPLGSLPVDGSALPGGDGSGGAAGAGGGDAGAAGGATDKDTRITRTNIGGTVKAGETGQDSGVTVTLTPALLGGDAGTSPAAAAALARGGSINHTATTKVWPDRYNRADPAGVSSTTQIESLQADPPAAGASTTTDTKGVWTFPDVLIRDNYEVAFSKPGFDSKSFIVTPTEDGKAVELDVQLDPAAGSASGVVNGPNGPLAGVDLVITDGILTFSTKTSSQPGQEGTWSVTGLSTPSTYTVTATLRGYGTEVLQLPLDAGQQRSGIGITMVQGVGSVSGHVTSGTVALGGITVTATAGDLKRETSSLTIGDAGAFSIPQLPIPGTYTITAAGDGYVTQTREITLGGNVSDIDFSLVRTTGSIIGLVTSDTKGPLPGVGITVRHDDLMFTATTAVAPSAGTFTIDQLPPGDYLVTFARYDHSEASQLITIAAGETKDLGTIALTFRNRPPLTETGRLVVQVFNSASVPLTGATVQLNKISDGSLVRQAIDTTGTQAAFAFEKVSIGTYSVKVIRNNYRTVTRRITMGLSEVQASFSLLKLGQVGGRLIDATDTSPIASQKGLRNYIIDIYRLKTDGTRDGAAVDHIVVPSAAPPDGDGYYSWMSQPSSLIDGTYEVAVTVPPSGYSVPPQILDTHTTNPAPMRFTILPNDENALKLNPIKVDPYPSLTGTVFAPVKNPADPNNPTLKPLTNTTTDVSLACPGGTTTSGAYDSVKGTYAFTPSVIGDNALIGACVVTVTSTGYVTATTPINLAVSSGGVLSNKVFDAALVLPVAPPIAGQAFWTDLSSGAPQYISGLNIKNDDNVIIGYDNTSGTPVPIVVGSLPGVLSGANGEWAVVGQVFGQTTYSFKDPLGKYEDATITVTIDENGTHVASGVSSTANIVGGNIRVELVPKVGGISGSITITTVNPTPDYASINIATKDPGGVTATIHPSTGGNYTIAAKPGTWKVDFTVPTKYVFAPESPVTSFNPLVPPAGTTTITPLRVVELGQVNVVVTDAAGVAINDAGVSPKVTLTRAGTGGPGDPGSDTSIAPVTLSAATTTATFANLAINTNAAVTSAGYHVKVEMAGYDVETANVTVHTNAGGADSTTTAYVNDVSAPVRPGEVLTITVKLAKYVSLQGTVKGLIGRVASDPQENLPYQAPLVITATRIALLDGSVPPTSPAVSVTTATVGGAPGFQIVGPPGRYTIAVSHPQYSGIFSQPAYDHPLDPQPTYDITATSRTLTTPFVLQISTGTVVIDAGNGAGAPVGDSTVTFAGGTPQLTDGFGQLVLTDIVPGDYTVQVRKYDTSNPLVTNKDERFPVLVTITVPRGSNPTARTVTFHARLLTLGGSITGVVGAYNSQDRPVPFPPTATITRTYAVGSAGTINASAATVPNGLTEANLSDPPDLTQVLTRDGTDPLSTETFLFDHLPAGHHTISASTEPGYLPLTGIADPIVGNSQYTVPSSQLKYVAYDVNVTVNVTNSVTGAAVNNATVVFSKPTAVGGTLTAGHVSNTNVFTYTAPPETTDYRLQVSAPLYTGYDQAQTIVIVTTTGHARTINVVLVPSASTISGVAKYQEGNDATSAGLTLVPSGEGTVKLFTSSGTQVGSDVTTGPNGTYSFPAVSVAGSYRVQLSAANHITNQTANFVVVLGVNSTAPDVAVKKLATQTFVVNTGLTETAAMTTPPAAVVPTCASNSCTFAGLTPTTAYTFVVGADQYRSQTFNVTPGVGDAGSTTVTLVPRTITVNVTTPDDGSDTDLTADHPNDAQAATVTLKIPSTDPGTPIVNSTNGTFVFSPAPFGAGSIVVTIAGYRTRTIALAADSGTDSTISAVMHKEVTITGRVTDNGSPKVTVGGALVTITNGTDTFTTTSAATAGAGVAVGDYSFPNLGEGTWTLSAVKDGVGITGAGVVRNIDANTNGEVPMTASDLVLVPRNTPRTFHVTETDPASGAVTDSTGASVAVTGYSTVATNGSGLSVFQVPENVTTLTWSVTKTGWLRVDGSGSVAGTPVEIGLRHTPVVSGTVSFPGTPPTPLAGVAVYFCKTNAPATDCKAGGTPTPDPRLANTTSAATTGAFSFTNQPPVAGDYRVRATYTDPADSKKYQAVAEITVATDGSVTVTSGSLTMVLA